MHFYKPDGTPVYEVACKDPKAKSPTRPTKVKDAKEMGLLWGVTDTLKVAQADGLINWYKRTWARAGYEFSRDGDFDAVWPLIDQEAEKTSEKARDYGSDWHSLVEKHAIGLPYDVPDSLAVTWGAFRKWWDANVNSVEFSELCLVGDGYAGRCDLCYIHKDGRRVIADYKTQKTTPGRRVGLYESFPCQLAAYAVAWQNKSGRTVDAIESVIVSSTEPGRVEAHSYMEPVERYYKLFMCLYEWNVYANDYDPRKANLTVDEKIAAAGL